MSSKRPEQNLLLALKISELLVHENKGDLDKKQLSERILARITEHPESVLDLPSIANGLATKVFRRHSSLRKKCEKGGDIFRPQMMIPIGPGLLTRFGTGGLQTVIGYQTETNKTLHGAEKIITRARLITGHCTALVKPLVENPTWDINRAEVECFGYKWRKEDDEPFSLQDLLGEDDEDEGGEA